MQQLIDVFNNHKQSNDDGRVFGLVLPGGGMRAVYSAGAVTTLLGYDLNSVFDHVIGVSAGAIHGAYFLAGDSETLENTYPEDLTNKNFVNLLRKNIRVYILEPSDDDKLVSISSIEKPKIKTLCELGATDMEKLLHSAVT